jgi:hypothetical protein
MLQRLPSLGYPALCFLAVLPLLAACNQMTASPPAGPVTHPDAMGSGVRAALADAQATRERHSSQATAMNVMSIFDPIGVTDIAEPIMQAEQQRELDEKYRRVDEEVQRTIAEAEAIKARNAAGSGSPSKAGARRQAPGHAR